MSSERDLPRGTDEETMQQEPGVAVVTAARPRPILSWTDATGPHTATIEQRGVIGAAPQADVVVSDPAVSRVHAELDPREDGLWITDLRSRNGTFVDEIMVTSARVPAGRTIRLGSTKLAVRYDPASTEVELWGSDRFGPLLGPSALMRELFARLARVAATDATVLIEGETGTGKELVAWALHEASSRGGGGGGTPPPGGVLAPRPPGPFVLVDCGSLPDTLLEAELFGHTRGAFTGAVGARAGAIEAADGGTVFLDEIGELPLAMQPKLLRAIESRMVRRLGETGYRKVDVRFIAATHRDLRAMVNAGSFREDLYFRLAVVPVVIPPLRSRPEDIPALIQHFMPSTGAPELAPGVLGELLARPWPGNIRELRNFVERLAALGPAEALAASNAAAPTAARASVPPGAPSVPPVGAPGPIPLDRPFKDLREEWLTYLEREYVRGMLAKHKSNVSAVAQAAGLARTYVHRLIRRYNL